MDSNRRNYYRILHVQPDAPEAVIRASYRTIMQRLKAHPDLGGDGEAAALLNEARAVLTDPARRAAYDADFRPRYGRGGPATGGPTTKGSTAGGPGTDGPTASPTGSPARSATDGTSGTRGGPTRPRAGTQDAPRIVCAFCRKPDTRALRADTLCTGCGSPLHPTSPLGPDARGRALPRYERNHPALLFTHWPQAQGLPAETRDLSPLGVRLVTTASLAVGSLIKLDSDVCRALVRITSAQRDPADGRCIVGGSFVTVLFSQPRGGFVSLRA